ncbi:MAG: TatD family hydrolase [Tissierellia bacterium]|nr:TatD family hydrolase [Tissierellia bacterium]
MYVNAHDHFELYEDLLRGLEVIHRQEIATLAVSMDLQGYRKLKAAYGHDPLIKIGLGIHPWKVTGESSLAPLEEELKTCDFIGEIGMDFFWAEEEALYPKQREIFEAFLVKAKDYDKVVNLHTKGAEGPILELLKKYRLRSPIIHWYSGPLELIPQYLDLGAMFTIGPDLGISPLTDELIRLLPLERILTETDGPSSVTWARGVSRDSSFIPEMVAHIAKLKERPLEEVKGQIYQNYLHLKI